ncbi:ribosomal protection tetracycline resistance protein [Kribbella amoyensis]|uniref:Ribosomal protection tetracycline resistance protein n=2 Tax=Kribbella amoyensis TaxID=996641 RepID=A0A561BJG9_9ACTN|nr:TetM/TetW/TetO/TetS family tetracycline resistance ribosomal protection protein [Kribbella amoyensis]TWD79019.1 ribosomal protection tetracycline resistance protein [Kribbella amoyensis]
MGILAHVDAGKTSLTERLLHAAGVVDRIGRVDDGDTRTDSMDLERRRGITIRSAVVSFELAGATINLIDTPGHSDFIAEVERALSVLDGAVLVISAVEGVQVQTRLLLRTLTRLRIPTLLFVNKIDRMGARYDSLLADIRRLLTVDAVPVAAVAELGTRAARTVPFAADDRRITEALAERNDEFLVRYLDETVTVESCRAELARQTAASLVRPVYFGSAMTGEGVAELIDGIVELLPRATGSAADPLQGSVFKVERGSAGEKIASARLFGGTLRAREEIAVHRGATQYSAKPTSVQVFERGGTRPVACAPAGRIVALRGIKEIQIGDQLGRPGPGGGGLFAPPTLETVVQAKDRGKLYQALVQLAEQDPLIQVRKDEEISVSLYGEVQKEVIASLLESEYGVAVTFSQTRPIHVERVDGVGSAHREIGASDNPWLAEVGFLVEPGAVGTGLEYRVEVEVGDMPRALHTAIEETVRQTVKQGPFGWEVTDLRVTVTHTGFAPPATSASDFRRLVPPVLLGALEQAGTTVHEPVDRFELEVPVDAVAGVVAKLAESTAVVDASEVMGDQANLAGRIPVARLNAFESSLPGLTHGEGVLQTTFAAYQPVVGEPPVRARTDGDPLNQKAYLLYLNQL